MFANLKFKIFHKCKLQKTTLKCFKYGKKIKFSNNLLKIRLKLVLQCMVERLLIKPWGFFFFVIILKLRLKVTLPLQIYYS